MKIVEASGARIPAIGFGTYRLEGRTCVSMVGRAIEAGYRHIDTARMYANEREVGEGIRASGIARDELFLTIKIRRDLIDARNLVASAEAAVETLGVGPVDLLLIHWPNADIPLAESIEALNEAKPQGLTRHISVANFTSAMVDEASALSEAPLVCNQVEYHPRLSQDAVLDACERHDMALVAYSPIGQGGALLGDPVVGRIAQRHGRTPAQIVLRGEIDQPRVAAIPCSSNSDRVTENIDLFGFELSDEDRAALRELASRRERLVNPSFAPVWDRV